MYLFCSVIFNKTLKVLDVYSVVQKLCYAVLSCNLEAVCKRGLLFIAKFGGAYLPFILKRGQNFILRRSHLPFGGIRGEGRLLVRHVAF